MPNAKSPSSHRLTDAEKNEVFYHQETRDAVRNIDAGFFSGDTFRSREGLARIEEYLSRWVTEATQIRALFDHEDTLSAARQRADELIAAGSPCFHAVRYKSESHRGHYLALYRDLESATNAPPCFDLNEVMNSLPTVFLQVYIYEPPSMYAGWPIAYLDPDGDERFGVIRDEYLAIAAIVDLVPKDSGIDGERIARLLNDFKAGHSVDQGASLRPATASMPLYAEYFGPFEDGLNYICMYLSKEEALEASEAALPLGNLPVALPDICVQWAESPFPSHWQGRAIEFVQSSDSFFCRIPPESFLQSVPIIHSSDLRH
jgi:hypothetical protein